MTPETYARACELDDDLPLDVCPGCGRDLTDMPPGTNHYTVAGHAASADYYRTVHHQRGRAALRPVFVDPATHTDVADWLCVWTGDLLAARTLRRRWRLEYEAAHA